MEYIADLIHTAQEGEELDAVLDLVFLVFGPDAPTLLIDARLQGDGLAGVARLQLYGQAPGRR